MASIDQPVLAIADADALSARIALTSGSLYLGSDLASGSYAIDLVADDGDLVSSPFVLTLTVESPVAFETLIIEGEALTPVDDGNTNTGDDSLIRTRTQNQERAGELNPDGQPLGSNETLGVDFDEYGLRPDYLGDGYFDINGPSGGKAETTLPDTFPMVAGSYDVYVRIANGSSSNRAITVGVDDVSATIAETQTGEFYFWGVRKVTLNLLEKTTDEARTLTVSTSASNGPNIDAIAIVEAGTPFSFVAPEITSSGAFSVDENTLSVGEVTAIDLDGETVTFSIVDSGDGAFFDINPDTGELAFKAAPDFETGPNTYTLTVEATDGAKTTAQTITVNVQDVPELDTPTIAPIILQGEDAVVPGGSNANTDDGTATFHRVQNDSASGETARNGQFDVCGVRADYIG